MINSSNKGSTTYRNGPDVSANANFTFYTCADQTSLPGERVWRHELRGSDVGGVYRAGESAAGGQRPGNDRVHQSDDLLAERGLSSYETDFHDITSGTSGSYSAVTGYDLVTGWGSPNGTGLINALQ